jgi:rhamnogalacturonan endolyase
MERLDRGLVAARVAAAAGMAEHVFLSWRLTGHDDEGGATLFDLERSDDGGATWTVLNAANRRLTNFQDVNGTAGSWYRVRAAGEPWSDPVTVWGSNVLEIDVTIGRPDDPGRNYRYVPYCAQVADLTGNGQLDIIFAWRLMNIPGAGEGMPNVDYNEVIRNWVGAFTLDGEHLWNITAGPNIAAYDSAVWVYLVGDFAGIGRPQVAMRTAVGAEDALGNRLGDPSAPGFGGVDANGRWIWNEAGNNHRNGQGTFYITVFDGLTGRALDTALFYPQTFGYFGDYAGQLVDPASVPAGVANAANTPGVTPWSWRNQANNRTFTGGAALWGDNRNHRGGSGFTGTVAYLGTADVPMNLDAHPHGSAEWVSANQAGMRPSMIFNRGMYGGFSDSNSGPGRTTTTAWDFCIDNGITMRWVFDTWIDDEELGFRHPVNRVGIGTGNHSLIAGDGRGLGIDDIYLGDLVICGSTGELIWAGRTQNQVAAYPGLGDRVAIAPVSGHGDQHHVVNFDPYRQGYQYFQAFEGSPFGITLRDAADGALIDWQRANGDTGRGIAANWGSMEHPNFPGVYALGYYAGSENAGAWAYFGYFDNGEVIPPVRVTGVPVSDYHRLYWDGSLYSNVLTAGGVNAHTARVWRPNPSAGTASMTEIFRTDQITTNRHTHSIMMLTADIFGDWREEIIARSRCSNFIRIYTTTIPTEHTLTTLMHDPHYRLGVSWWNSGTRSMTAHASFVMSERYGTAAQPKAFIADMGRRGVFVTEQVTQHVAVYAGSSATLVFDAELSGVPGGSLSYQWYQTDDPRDRHNGTPIAGATAQIFTIPADLPLGRSFFYAVAKVNGAADPDYYTWDTPSLVSHVLVLRAPGELTASDITVTTMPLAMTYTSGSPLSYTGMEVLVTFSDGSAQAVPFADFDINGLTVSPEHGTPLYWNEHDGMGLTVTFGSANAVTRPIGNITVNTTAVNAVSVPDGALIRDLRVHNGAGNANFSLSSFNYLRDFGNPSAALFADRAGNEWAQKSNPNFSAPADLMGLDWLQTGMEGRQNPSAEAIVFTANARIEVTLGIDMRNDLAEDNSGRLARLLDGWAMRPITNYIQDGQTLNANARNTFDASWVATDANPVRYYLFSRVFREGETVILPNMAVGGTNTNCYYLIMFREVEAFAELNVEPLAFNAEAGAALPSARPLVIRNVGDADAVITNVTVSDGEAFEVVVGTGAVSAGGANETWMVRPMAGLPVGEHTAMVTVTYDGGETATAAVTFTVSAGGTAAGTDNGDGDGGGDNNAVVIVIIVVAAVLMAVGGAAFYAIKVRPRLKK